MNRIDYDTAMEIASHEAIIREAYKDSVGVWTWSVGLTSATGHDVERYIGKPQSLELCLAIYVWALEKYARDVRQAFGRELKQHEFAAALSFHWNTGAIRRATWVRRYKAGDIAGARRAMMNWTKAGGKVVKGLVTRRRKERGLFFDGEWTHDGTMTEYRVKNGKPDWSSARRINVESDLKAALGIRQPDDPGPAPERPPLVVGPAIPPKPKPPDPFIPGWLWPVLIIAAALGAAFFWLR